MRTDESAKAKETLNRAERMRSNMPDRIRDDVAAEVVAEGKRAGLSPMRALREHRQISLEGLAAAAGLEVDALRLCEEVPDTCKPTPENRLAIATLIGVSPEMVFGASG